jgi:hypothetical protein
VSNQNYSVEKQPASKPPHEVGEFLKGTPRTVLSDTDYYRHRYDDGHGKPKPSRDNSGLRESTPRGSTIQREATRNARWRTTAKRKRAKPAVKTAAPIYGSIAALAHNGVRQYANPSI